MLDRFPPGQAATRIIPKAMEGWGFKTRVNRKVNAGSRINWAIKPMQGALGETRMRLKSSSFRSRETPSIIRPMAALIAMSPWGLKLSRT